MFNEERYKEEAQKHIERCRPGDWNHALRVVKWVQELGEGREDLPLLLQAAYIHDIGWRDVLLTRDKFQEFYLVSSAAGK